MPSAPPVTPVVPPPAAAPGLPAQQIVIQPRSGVTTGQVILIVLAVLLLTPFASCVVCAMVAGAGVGAASSTSARPAAAAPAPALRPLAINEPAKAAPEPGTGQAAPEPGAQAATAEPDGAKPAELDPALFRWKYDVHEDEMSGKPLRRAMLVSETTYNFAFPYHGGTICVLRIAEHPRRGLSVAVTINKGQFVCHSFTGCRITVRFDDRPPIKFRGVEPEDYSSTMIFFEPEKKFLKEIKNSKEMWIELPFYREGRRVFKFNTSDLQWD